MLWIGNMFYRVTFTKRSKSVTPVVQYKFTNVWEYCIALSYRFEDYIETQSICRPLIASSAYSSIMKIETLCFSETFVNSYNSTHQR
jgi:hypothetical protein